MWDPHGSRILWNVIFIEGDFKKLIIFKGGGATCHTLLPLGCFDPLPKIFWHLSSPPPNHGYKSTPLFMVHLWKHDLDINYPLSNKPSNDHCEIHTQWRIDDSLAKGGRNKSENSLTSKINQNIKTTNKLDHSSFFIFLFFFFHFPFLSAKNPLPTSLGPQLRIFDREWIPCWKGKLRNNGCIFYDITLEQTPEKRQ